MKRVRVEDTVGGAQELAGTEHWNPILPPKLKIRPSLGGRIDGIRAKGVRYGKGGKRLRSNPRGKPNTVVSHFSTAAATTAAGKKAPSTQYSLFDEKKPLGRKEPSDGHYRL